MTDAALCGCVIKALAGTFDVLAQHLFEEHIPPRRGGAEPGGAQPDQKFAQYPQHAPPFRGKVLGLSGADQREQNR